MLLNTICIHEKILYVLGKDRQGRKLFLILLASMSVLLTLTVQVTLSSRGKKAFAKSDLSIVLKTVLLR